MNVCQAPCCQQTTINYTKQGPRSQYGWYDHGCTEVCAQQRLCDESWKNCTRQNQGSKFKHLEHACYQSNGCQKAVIEGVMLRGACPPDPITLWQLQNLTAQDFSCFLQPLPRLVKTCGTCFQQCTYLLHVFSMQE